MQDKQEIFRSAVEMLLVITSLVDEAKLLERNCESLGHITSSKYFPLYHVSMLHSGIDHGLLSIGPVV